MSLVPTKLRSLIILCVPVAACTPGPFFLTLAGSSGVMPDLSDPDMLRAVARAVRDALKLGPAYPLDNIRVWVHAQQEVGTTLAPTRHLSAVTATKICCLVIHW